MSGTLFSLISVVVAFSALLIWVYAPSRKSQWSEVADLPFADEKRNECDAESTGRGESS